MELPVIQRDQRWRLECSWQISKEAWSNHADEISATAQCVSIVGWSEHLPIVSIHDLQLHHAFGAIDISCRGLLGDRNKWICSHCHNSSPAYSKDAAVQKSRSPSIIEHYAVSDVIKNPVHRLFCFSRSKPCSQGIRHVEWATMITHCLLNRRHQAIMRTDLLDWSRAFQSILNVEAGKGIYGEQHSMQQTKQASEPKILRK